MKNTTVIIVVISAINIVLTAINIYIMPTQGIYRYERHPECCPRRDGIDLRFQ